MSFRTNFYPLLEQYRTLLGPTKFDIVMNQVTIRTTTWSGQYINEGTPTYSDLVLPQKYPVRLIKATDVAASGGEYKLTDVLVDGITPVYTVDQLDPPRPTENIEVTYILDGSLAGTYSLLEGRFAKPFTWQLVLRRKFE